MSNRLGPPQRYVFLVKIAVELLRIIDLSESNFPQLSSFDRKQLKKIRVFLSRNNEIDKSFWQNLTSFFNIFSKFSVKLPGEVEAGLETRQIETINDLSTMLDKFEGCILNVSSGLRDFNTTILVDEVDDIWDSTEESPPLIIGLLNAIRKLNSSFNPNVVILIFLRSDIWDKLSFSDKDKFRSEDERINWSEVELKRLITARGRISANLVHLHSNDVEQIWETLFENQVKSQDSFKYIIDRTLKRPREVIQFCNLALSIAQDHNRSQVKARDILAAEARYSIWKLDDLINEFKVQYPFLRDLLGIFQGFEVSFTKAQISKSYGEIKEISSEKFPELIGLDLDSFLQILFAIGFVGARVGAKDIYLHDDPDYPRIVLTNLKYLEAIIIHPAFHLALGLREYVDDLDGANLTQTNFGGTNYQVQIGGDIAGNVTNFFGNFIKQRYQNIFAKRNIAILGDKGSGKTSLIFYLQSGKPLAVKNNEVHRPEPTVNSVVSGDKAFRHSWKELIKDVDPHGIIYMLDGRVGTTQESITSALEPIFNDIFSYYIENINYKNVSSYRLQAFHIFISFSDYWAVSKGTIAIKETMVRMAFLKEFEQAKYKHLENVHIGVSTMNLSPNANEWREADRALNQFGADLNDG